ncbi:hypothetical protein I350_07721 [Cryptococcus amylolentus CBS 6273]|uniref:Dystroglycan-type cadherin-like domain-containing protein n=1 Tax=Cryptococcus amylolentus CBS 6273 TaxID=1296118 RepID=A0A1E3JB52_9TREE|nr:hypothetical protein I350_07721 [Cryptococcus amylolentus CBS 6273]
MLNAYLSLALALLSTQAGAAPSLNYPPAEQLPPVARVGSTFAFDLLPNTFNSSSTITYNTSTLPTWLSWDAPTLSFYGTPALSDEGETPVQITATDDTGSTRTNFTLIVTNYTSPAVHESFFTQTAAPSLHDIASASILPNGTGVSIPPWWSFSLGFQWDTFRLSKENNNGKLYNAAHARGYVGLPSWLNFDNNTFTFTGVAPGEGSYTIVATGTDFWGYTGAQTSFVIEIGEGQGIEMARDFNFSSISTIAKGKVDYDVDLSGVLVGGSAAEESDLNVTLASEDFSWLSYDSSKNVLSGTVPDSYQNGTSSSLSIPLTIASANTSNTLTLSTWLALDITPYFFSTYSLPNATVSPSSQYSLDLSQYLTNSTAQVNATVSPNDAASWLTYYTENKTLIGTAPESPKYNQVAVVFEAVVGGLTATTTLDIGITGVSDTSGSTGTASVPSNTSSSAAATHHGLSTGAKIALGVVFGLLGLILLLVLLWFLCCRRRKDKKDDDESDEKRPRASAGPDLGDPFRRSVGLEPVRSINDTTLGYSDTTAYTARSPASMSSNATAVEKPHRLDGMKGIITWDETGEEHLKHNPDFSRDFVGYPDVIATQDPVDANRSDYTRSFTSASSRASWQSKSSFNWSSGDGSGEGARPFSSEGQDLERAAAAGGIVGLGMNRMSTAESIPRPRPDFTPRYPRHQSPAVLARLTGEDSLSSHDSFSEFHSSYEGAHDSYQSRSAFDTGSNFDETMSDANTNSMMGTGSVFQSRSQQMDSSGVDSMGFRRSGLSQIGESSDFKTSDTDGTDGEGEEAAVLATARRTSVDTRGDSPRVIQTDRAARDAHTTSGMFDDAESRPSTMYDPSSNAGLGYPNSVIYFGSPQPGVGEAGDEAYTSQRASGAPSESTARASTIRAVPFRDSNPISPSLPQSGSFIRHRRTNTAGSGFGSQSSSRVVSGASASGANDGRVYATSNETFSIHPAIHPPPTVQLSAATWSSNPPSTYRAELEGGGSLPGWLHFDARELELWGVPPQRVVGEQWVVRILEKLPRDPRRADPSSFGYEPPQEREVGRVMVEVTDKMRSPQFSYEGSPHAL